jgi:hypothetical protein
MRHKSKNRDPRFAGLRILLCGLAAFIFGVSMLFLRDALNGNAILIILSIVAIPIASIGWIVAAIGMYKHYKIFFGPIDPRREVDPGYDFDYVTCPSCGKAKVRFDTKPLRCPICKTKLKKGSF